MNYIGHINEAIKLLLTDKQFKFKSDKALIDFVAIVTENLVDTARIELLKEERIKEQ